MIRPKNSMLGFKKENARSKNRFRKSVPRRNRSYRQKRPDHRDPRRPSPPSLPPVSHAPSRSSPSGRLFDSRHELSDLSEKSPSDAGQPPPHLNSNEQFRRHHPDRFRDEDRENRQILSYSSADKISEVRRQDAFGFLPKTVADEAIHTEAEGKEKAEDRKSV